MTIDVDITPEHYQIINDILTQHLPTTCTVWAFGSRVKHTAKRHPINGYRLYNEKDIKALMRKIQKGESLDG
ncbi:hypothetical protein CL648_00765 [bacterium]|jgi:hypothetical protein|nr:hypothetical protein [bacterium]|tara:strand:+ start:790 stop:1005 length:216 start_codon:yes stop_codon:yes gene_type:complete